MKLVTLLVLITEFLQKFIDVFNKRIKIRDERKNEKNRLPICVLKKKLNENNCVNVRGNNDIIRLSTVIQTIS